MGDQKIEGVNKQVEKELTNLPEDFVMVFISPTEKYFDTNVAVVDFLVNKRKMKGVYVTMNKPYETIMGIFKKKNINTDKLFFIDAISKVIGSKITSRKNCIMLESPFALTDISIAITNACHSNEFDPKFLLLDSMSAMLVYNSEGSTTRFIHYIITQLRNLKLAGIIFSLEDTKKEVISSISQFCDKCVKIA